jgi:hypothetical protein
VHTPQPGIVDPKVWRPTSAQTMIPQADRAEGMRHLRADLGDREWDPQWGQLFKLEELDPGYRVVAAWPASRRVV